MAAMAELASCVCPESKSKIDYIQKLQNQLMILLLKVVPKYITKKSLHYGFLIFSTKSMKNAYLWMYTYLDFKLWGKFGIRTYNRIVFRSHSLLSLATTTFISDSGSCLPGLP